MLKKEINDVLKQIAFFAAIVLLLPAFLIVTTIISDQSYFSVFFPLFQYGMICWAFFLGASLFSLEHGQRGMEYLLSLPYSRLQLIGMKIIPRLTSALIFFVVFLILHNRGGEDLVAFPLALFTAIYFFVFLISLSLSANSENFLVLFVVSFFSTFIFFGLIFLILRLVLLAKNLPFDPMFIRDFFSWEHVADASLIILFVGFVLLIPFLISFLLSFKKFDIRPAKAYNKRYFKYFTPIFAICFIIIFLFVFLVSGPGYKQYYLTQDLKLIESIPYSRLKIYEGDKVHEVKGDFYFWSPSLEDNEYLYDLSFDKIVRLNTSDYTAEVLYEVPPDRKIGWHFCKYDQTIACVERERKKDFYDIQLVLVDETSKEVTRIPLENKLLEKSYVPIHIWTDKTDGNRFWLISTGKHRNNQILRIWEDGRIENLGDSQKAPTYVNKMLISYTDEEIIISREKDGRFETVRKIPNSKDFQFGIGIRRANLSNVTLKEIFGWRRGPKHRIRAKLNLENFEIEEIGETKGYMFYFSPDEIYIHETNHTATTVKIHEFKEGNLNLLKTFTDFDTREMTNRFRLCRGGVIIREGNKVRVYAFPDLREIKFGKL